jgi:hypothetical protein
VSSVTSMQYMFIEVVSFNQDLSDWCVTNFSEDPGSFATNSSLQSNFFPVWGTCPIPDTTPPTITTTIDVVTTIDE